MQEKTVFISFDLGLRGDYTGLYSWLDQHEAKECGNGLAAVKFAFEGDILSTLEQDLQNAVRFEKTDRLYIIWKDDQTGKFRGKFLLGNRKAAPWEGYAKKITAEDIVE